MSSGRPGRRARADSPFVDAARELSVLLREQRRRRGLDQAEVSRRSGVSLSTVSKIESLAVVEPGLFTVLAMAAAVGMPVAELAVVAAALPAAPAAAKTT